MNNQEILDNAPEGATHIDRFGDYQKLNKDGESYQWTEMIGGNFNWHPEKPIASGLRSLADIKRIAELEKRLVAPTDSGVVELDVICEKFNNNNNSNLCGLTSSIWNKAYFEALKEQGK